MKTLVPVLMLFMLFATVGCEPPPPAGDLSLDPPYFYCGDDTVCSQCVSDNNNHSAALEPSSRNLYVCIGQSSACHPCATKAFIESMEEYTSMPTDVVACRRVATLSVNWLPESTLFQQCIERINTTVEAGGTFQGATYFQGQSNSYSLELRESWAQEFPVIVESLRSEMNHPVPLVFAQLALKDMYGWEQLKLIQADVAEQLYDQEVRMITTDHLAIKAEDAHPTSESQLEIGAMFAEEHYLMISP